MTADSLDGLAAGGVLACRPATSADLLLVGPLHHDREVLAELDEGRS